MSEKRIVKSTVENERLLEALEDAEEGSSMAQVVREALRTHLLVGEDDEDLSALSETARKGLQALRKNVDGERGRIEVSAATSQVAQATGVPSSSIRKTVFGPLRRHGKIGVITSVEACYITVRPEKGSGGRRTRDPLAVGAGPTNYAVEEAEEVSADD